MVVRTRTTRALAGAFALSLGALLAPCSQAHEHDEAAYSISTPDTELTGYVTGTSLTIQIGAPPNARISRIALKLNGADVTGALHPDGAGSMSGVVAGLQPGANVFELWSKTSKESVARLTVMKAMAPAVTCTSLATLTDFPVQPSGSMAGTRITTATLVSATGTVPEYCLVQGILQERNDGTAGIAGTSSYRTNQHYGTLFEVRLPTAWNGRYMFQGSGGTEGSRPAATGQIGGTAGLTILRNGFVVASQNGGHQTSELPASYPPNSTTTDLNHIQVIQGNMFFPDAQAVKDWGYNSIDITTQTAKFLVNAYYGRPQERSYFVGCSTSGRQGMAMSQLFPRHYDGIVAGDPFYLPPDISLSETWGLEQIISVSPIVNGTPQYLQSFTLADQNLFTNAILAACDALDGLVDGVIDNHAACTFDPATFVFPSSGVYGSIAPGMPLQCTGDKTPTCLTPAQVTATKKIAQGPRTSNGDGITSPDGTPLSGYPFDGGFMQPSGIPTRDIGTANSAPGNIGLGSGQLPLFWFATPDPTYNPLTVDYDNDIGLVTPSSPAVNNSTDVRPFVRRGGKIIFYHGLSDSGPPWPYTLKYFRDVARKHGGIKHAGDFMKLYLIPNMGHCSGNMATDSFDMLTPMVNWIENGVAPKEILATGTRFQATPGPYTGLGSSARSRPLCPYPNTLRYKGPGDISQASSYMCVAPQVQHEHEKDDDDDKGRD
jgi:feruloyl esterase